MRTEIFGELRARVGGGIDREGGGTGPVVVLFHGYGAPGDDLVALARVLAVPREVRFVFPEAPLTLSLPVEYGSMMDSRAWWHIDMERLQRTMMSGRIDVMSQHVPEGITEARALALNLIDAVEDALAPSSIVLGGFSQGGMLACDVALHSAHELAGLALMSSTLLAESEWVPRMSARRGLPVFQSHGQRDPLLAFSAAELLRDRLVSAGLPVTWVPFGGAHEIPPSVLDELGRFLTEVTSQPAATP